MIKLNGDDIALGQYTNDPLGKNVTQRCAIGWIRYLVCKKSYLCQMSREENKLVDKALHAFLVYLKDRKFQIQPGSGIRPVILWSDATLVSTVAHTLNNFFAGYSK